MKTSFSWPSSAVRFLTILVTIGLLSFVLLVNVTADPLASMAARSNYFWGRLQVNGTYQTYDSLVQMTAASDAVVVGTIRDIRPSRSIVAVPDWGPDGVFQYAVADVQVTQVLAGSFTGGANGSLELELFLPVPGELERVKDAYPLERTAFFVTRKTDLTAPTYGLLNPVSYVRDLGGAQPAPGSEQDWLLNLAGTSFDAFLDQVRASHP